MTGFERNPDIVGMTAYAPLFSKIGSTHVEDSFAISGPEITIKLKPSSLTILRCNAKLPK